MIVSLVYKVPRKLLSVPAVLLRRNISKGTGLLVLRHENAVLCRQSKGPVRYEPAGRFWFAAPSGPIPRRYWHEVFPRPHVVLAGKEEHLLDNRRQALTTDVRGIVIEMWVNTLPRLKRGEPRYEIGVDDSYRRRRRYPESADR
ncbi:hypothetical protein [Streptomyces viridosporus]|uniref:hypothetical protein n=1 Tax=Streptomyces viridosporus TaxID=67581 RepID=UPI0009C1A26A|nr:hypothetical protein [Streptomyces viridosporus]